MHGIKVSEKKKSILINLFGVFFGLLFLSAGLFIFAQGPLSYIIAQTMGVSTQGFIEKTVESEAAYYDEGIANNVVYYYFTLPNGETIGSTNQLSRDSWDTLKTGQRVTVRYFPHYPSFNYLVGYQVWNVKLIMMIVFPMLFGGLGIYVIGRAIQGIHRK